MTKKKLAFLAVSSALLVLVLSAALFGQVTPKDSIFKYLSIFTEVFALARSHYVEPVAQEQLIEGAFGGVTDAVDEFSYYVPPTQIAEYRSYTADETNRIGLVVTKRLGYPLVISTIKGSLAERAGIDAGDYIEKINGQVTHKMAVWQIRNLLTRTSDKPLTLSILRADFKKREEVKITPAPFEAPLPKLTEYGSVAHVEIPHFSTGTTDALASLLEQVRASGKKKLIVDVRGNAAGSIEEAVRSADLLLREGVITTLVGRKVPNRKWTADSATAFDGEVQVLTDQSTASGAEVFAASLRDNKRAKLVGVTTYGKAIEQKLIPLTSGGALYLTIANYTTPDGKAIKEQGIRPDVVVDLTANFLAKSEDRPEEDLILRKALTLFGEDPARAAA